MRLEKEILTALELKRPIIWVKTIEEADFIKDLIKTLSMKYTANNIYTWSLTSPLSKVEMFKLPKPVGNNASIGTVFAHIRNNIEKSLEPNWSKSVEVFIMKDLHLNIENPQTIRGIRDTYEQLVAIKDYYYPMLVVSPEVNLPMELEHLVTVIDFPTPSKQEISLLLDSTSSMMAKKNLQPISPALKAKMIDGLYGLTLLEIKKVISESIKTCNTLSLDVISKFKIAAIKNTGLLSYKIPKNTLADVGGNDTFKHWIDDIKHCMTKEAREFGLAAPKGYLALGLPGTSKTFMAEAFANELNVPFLSLDMSKIMHKHVGQSERNMSRALELIKSCSPCVLLIDEVEKALSGIQSNGKSDGGTLARTFGSILQFLNEDNGVFTVMTSNDVTQLPPELTRAGRLDAIWYFSLPTSKEREQIFKVHLGKINQEIPQKDLEQIVELTKDYTGAEIEQIVKASHMKAFINKVKNKSEGKVTIDELKESINLVVPISKSSKEKIDALEAWSKGRALYANKDNVVTQHAYQDDDWEIEFD